MFKKAMKKIETLNKKAYTLLKGGLFAMIAAFVTYIAYIINSENFSEYSKLYDTFPALVASVILIVAGSFVFDSIIKESENKK